LTITWTLISQILGVCVILGGFGAFVFKLGGRWGKVENWRSAVDELKGLLDGLSKTMATKEDLRNLKAEIQNDQLKARVKELESEKRRAGEKGNE